jgi:hypothetical protein
MRLYYYVFYCIYRVWIKMDGTDHAFKAMAALSLILMWNFITIAIYFEVFDNIDKYTFVVTVIGILVINYFVFIHNKKYLEIEELFKNESKAQKKIGGLATLIYAIFSLVIMLWNL